MPAREEAQDPTPHDHGEHANTLPFSADEMTFAERHAAVGYAAAMWTRALAGMPRDLRREGKPLVGPFC